MCWLLIGSWNTKMFRMQPGKVNNATGGGWKGDNEPHSM